MVYEIMAIIPSKFADSEIDSVISRLGEVLKNSGATVEKMENLGKIKMAYPIERERFGTYVLFYITAEGEVLQKLEQNLSLAEETIRHLIVARPDGIPTGKYSLIAYQPPLSAEGRRAGSKEEKADAPRAPKAPAQPVMTEEDIAVKVDAIIEDDVTKTA